jgi:hypothetical protein
MADVAQRVEVSYLAFAMHLQCTCNALAVVDAVVVAAVSTGQSHSMRGGAGD